MIDSRQSRNWWARYLGPIPPRTRIPIVHATHVWRIARALLGGHSVVAHTRGTWPHILYGFAWLARRVGSEVHLILLDVEPRIAREGQLVPRPGRHRRHLRPALPALAGAHRPCPRRRPPPGRRRHRSGPARGGPAPGHPLRRARGGEQDER